MKIRNGFVSNSSASSFIVRHIDGWLGEQKTKNLTKKDISKLVAFGFKETNLTHPTHLDHVKYDDQSVWTPFIDKDGKILISNYGYWVSCNEDEPIAFLVKNNIPFIASVHYGHETWMFRKNDKFVMRFKNYGCEIETYHQGDSWDKIMEEWKITHVDKNEAWSKIPIKKLI